MPGGGSISAGVPASLPAGNSSAGVGGGGIDKKEDVKVQSPEGDLIELKPFQAFSDCPWPQSLQLEIQKAGYSTPSQIQAYTWPLALQGYDVIGVAATGSGKTIAFLFPAFAHIMSNNIGSRDPTLLVLAPTRELAVQIEKEAQRFGTSSQIRTVCTYGGAPKHLQLTQMRSGCHCLIATPGRLNDFLEAKQINLDQIAKMVLDEADRMLDMGFEPQIRKILKEVPRKRHTLFFSATWPKEVRKLAEDFLHKPYKVQIGDRDELKANEDITQVVKIVTGFEKNQALLKTLQEYNIGRNIAERCMVFAGTKRMCDQLERDLQRSNYRACAIHGDKDQRQRDEALDNFRQGRCHIMVATDVAARGLDIKGVVLVINFDPANNTEDYVHRIGRTGRAGQKGTAVTYVTSDQAFKAQGIVEIMDKTNQTVTEDVRRLAASAPPPGKGKGRFREGGDREDRDGDIGGFGKPGSRGKGKGDIGAFGGPRGMPSSNPFDRDENRNSSASPPRRKRSRSRSRRGSRSRRRRSRSRRRRSPSRKTKKKNIGRRKSPSRSKSRSRSPSRRKSQSQSRCRARSRSRSRRRSEERRPRRGSPTGRKGDTTDEKPDPDEL